MTLLPITATQYFGGLLKYIMMLQRANTIEDYNKTEGYRELIEKQRLITDITFISSSMISAMQGVAQRTKQEKLKKIIQSEQKIKEPL